jgi:integrase
MRHDHQRRTRINPGDYACAALAGQLADEWADYARIAALRDACSLAVSIRAFARSVDSRAGAESPPLFAKPPGQPLDEFSNRERIALQAAARTAVRAMHQRLREGRALLQRGADPDIAGWSEPANLLWALDRGTLTVERMRRHLPRRLLDWPPGLLGLVPAGMQATCQSVLLGLCHQLYPSALDLQAFRVLLLLSMTGCTPEELHDLRLEDIEFTDGAVRLTQAKHRAHRVRGIQYRQQLPDADAVPGQAQPSQYPRCGRWDVPGLLRQILDVTSAARDLPGAPAWLFITVGPQADDTPPVPHVPSFSTPRTTFSWWINTRKDGEGLAISAPHDIRRLRKTMKTAAVAALGGTLADLAGDDHSVEVFRGHYAHGTTAHVLSGKAINRAQDRVFRRLARGPLYLDAAAAGALTGPGQAQAAGLTAEQVMAINEGELDMGLTHCRDPYHSQFTPAGQLCHVAPAMCMLCANAVIFPAQLPRLVMLAEHIEKMRAVLAPPHWAAVWRRQAAALAVLFAEAGEDALRTARQAAGAGQASLDLPLGMRAEYDR